MYIYLALIFLIIIFFLIIAYKKPEKIKKQESESTQKIELSEKEQGVYEFYNISRKALYDAVEKEQGWTESSLDELYDVDMTYMYDNLKEKYQLDEDELNEIIDKGDILASKQLTSLQIAIQMRFDEIDPNNEQRLETMLQVARELDVSFYEIEEALDLYFEYPEKV